MLAGAAIEHGDLGGAPAEPRVKPGCVKRREFLREIFLPRRSLLGSTGC